MSSTSRRSGFTFIELLMVVTIIGILAAIAIPKFRTVKRRATATQMAGDFDVVRHAAMSFYVDSGYFPAEAEAGATPQGLKSYLPTNFTFQRPDWTIDYENWGSHAPTTKTSVLVGVSFTTPDEQLGQTAMVLLGNAPSFTVGSKYTVMIAGM